MLHLNENLKKELATAIVDFWIDSAEKYCQVIDLVLQHGVWNAATVLLEEVWIMSEGLVDKSFNHLIQALFPSIRHALETEFSAFIRTGEVSCASNA